MVVQLPALAAGCHVPLPLPLWTLPLELWARINSRVSLLVRVFHDNNEKQCRVPQFYPQTFTQKKWKPTLFFIIIRTGVLFVRFVLFFLLPPNWEGLKYTVNANPISAHFNCLIVMATRWVLGTVKPEKGCRGKCGAVILMYPKQVWGCNIKRVYIS